MPNDLVDFEYTPLTQTAAPKPKRRATARQMFYWLLPASVCLGILIPSWMISPYSGDDRDFGGACIFLLLVPAAIVYSVKAAFVGLFRGAARAFLWGLLGNILFVATMSAVFYYLSKR